MPNLEITYANGRTETRRLSRRNPIVVGRNPISDVHIDDAGVAPIHCRVLWNGTHFEVAATSEEGIDVNGVMVQRKRLAAGDTIRVGKADLVIARSTPRPAESATAGRPSRSGAGGEPPKRTKQRDDFESDENFFAEPGQQTQELSFAEWDALAGQHDEESSAETRRGSGKRKPERNQSLEAETEVKPRRDAGARTERSDVAGSATESASESVSEPGPVDGGDSQDGEEGDFDPRPVLLEEPEAKKSKEGKEKKETPPVPAKWDRMRVRKRPGEQDILTSPVVLGLGGLALALLLASAATWLLIGREHADRLYQAAVEDRESGRYLQAISGFERFLLDFPTDARIPDARVALGLTKIERHSQSASPNFDEALQAFDEFVRNHRDQADFAELRATLAGTAAGIATGATSAAIRTGDRDYLAPADRAAKLFSQFGGQGTRDKETRSKLDAEFAKAEAAVRKQEYFTLITERIQEAIGANQFIAAYEARNDLLARYGDFRENRRIDELLRGALESEKSLVRAGDAESEATIAPAEDRAGERPALMLMGHTEARLGEVSDGRLVVAVAADQLVGLDAVTGKPVWQTPIGAESPFFPVPVDAAVRSVLVFDASRNDLLLVKWESGEVVWRAPIGQLASGPPHVAQGQVDLVTVGGRLARVSLETGELLASVHFPQPLVGSPLVTSDGEHLVVLGEQSTAYILDLRSLEMRGASYLGHPAGSLAVAPQRLGRLILIFENDQLKRATIRAFAFDPATARLNLVATEGVEGTIQTPPMPRGNVMFVASMPERITAFSVSDDTGQPPLTRLAGVQVPNPRPLHTFLVPGSDGVVWAAGSALRKLKLEAESLKILPGELAVGEHRQPVQESGESLFVARTLPSSKAIYVSQADRDAMTGNWRCVLGASVIAWASSEGGLRLVTDAGQVATLNPGNLASDGFLNTAPLPGWEEGGEKLGGANLSDGTAVVWQGGKTPRLWRVGPTGNIAAAKTIGGTLQAPPILLGSGLVLPLAGRLEWSPGADGGAVEPFLLPVTGEDDAPAWGSLVALDDESFAVKSADGTLRVLRRRVEPQPHFAEIATAALSAQQNTPIAAFAGDLFIAADQRLEKLDTAGLRPTGEVTFSDMIQGGPWVVGKQVIIRTESGDVVSVDGESLEENWRLKVESPLAGTPKLVDAETNAVRLASQDGTVIVVDSSGSEESRTVLPQRLTGQSAIGELPVAVAWSGAVVPLGDAPPAESVQAEPMDPPMGTPMPEAAESAKPSADGPVEPVVATKAREDAPVEESATTDTATTNEGAP